MGKFTLEELYRGDKYNILGCVAKDLLEHGLDGDELQTKIELLTIKHTLLTAEKMKQEGDCVSGLTDIQPPFCMEVSK